MSKKKGKSPIPNAPPVSQVPAPSPEELELSKAQAILAQYQQAQMQEFSQKLEALLTEYGLMLSARFGLFGQAIDPPISVMPAAQQPAPPQG